MVLKTKRFPKAPSRKELIRELKGIDALCSRSRTIVDREVLENSSLSSVAAFCIGVNQIDLETAGKLGIPVFNAPYGNTRSVAEMVISMIISLSRSLFYHAHNMKKGQWEKFTKDCFEIRGKTLGIIGYGNIGSQVSVLAEALGMKVIYYDIVRKLPLGNAKPVFSLESLLKKSDFITLHVPQTGQTKDLIGKKELLKMKEGSFLINLSRGTVVDLKALEEVLKKGSLKGAAIDVFLKNQKLQKLLSNTLFKVLRMWF